MRSTLLLCTSFFLNVLIAFSQEISATVSCSGLDPANFITEIDGNKVGLYFLRNGDLSAAITNYGGRLVSLCAPDRNGKIADVVVGFKSIHDYLKATGIYHGAIIGRVAGRIANGTFEIDGQKVNVPINNGPNHLHGGPEGFHNQVWTLKSHSANTLVLSYYSKDGEMGYPGNLFVEATYSLTSENELVLKLTATSDKATTINLTNHTFFNLAGEGSGTILNHHLTIPARFFCKLNDLKVNTGKKMKVVSTPFDFRKGKTIGHDISMEDSDPQLKIATGYDHCFVLKNNDAQKLIMAAKVVDDTTGRILTVSSTSNGIHFFSANFFSGVDIGKSGKPINFRESFALETQNCSTPNSSAISNILVRPGQLYTATTIYKFSN